MNDDHKAQQDVVLSFLDDARRKALAIAAAIVLCGCARSATMQLSAGTFQLVTSAAPVCGRTGAQNVAARRAAIETVNRGYDKFLIVGGAAENMCALWGIRRFRHTRSARRQRQATETW